MLTFLSQSIRHLLNGAPAADAPSQGSLAVVKPFGHRDMPAAFVAGQGARIYSLEVFRDARRGGEGPRDHAA